MSFTSFTFGLSTLQALYKVVGQPTIFVFPDKMTSLDFFDMYFVIFAFFDQYLIKIGRKFT
jgi:hypothetical protein